MTIAWPRRAVRPKAGEPPHDQGRRRPDDGRAPGSPIVTVHDAILTPGRHAEAVRSMILGVFGDCGITPTIRMKESA